MSSANHTKILQLVRRTSQYGCEDVLAKDFVSLMDMYEENFIKLRKLIPQLDLIEKQCVSSVPGHLDLHLRIIERSRYTTTLMLSYCFETQRTMQMEPNLKIRVYHDAGLAEVMSGRLHHGRLVLEHLPSDALKQKWQLNRFLSKWLKYCLRQQHGFSAGSSTPDGAIMASLD
jgi:uncharacterized protein YqiB (DUF1249 family)